MCVDPYHRDDSVTVYHGDCLNILQTLPDNSIDAVVTDPPYLLGFMGRQWDTRAAHEHLDWHGAWSAECFRVLKPGGHIAAFGGTRTWHRLAVAVEDAGFEIRDNLAWLYGSGFPKSLDVSKAIDKAAGAEPVVVGTVTRTGSQGAGSTVHQEGGDKSGVCHLTQPTTDAAKQWQGWGTALKPAWESIVLARKPHGNSDILDAIGSQLDRLELECKPTASDAAKSSAPIPHDLPAVRTASAPANAVTTHEAAPVQPTATGKAAGSSAATATSASESVAEMCLSTVASWRRCWVELCDLTSTFTTATNASTTTDLRTLNSCLAQITPASIIEGQTNPPGLTSIASAVDSLFASVVCGLRATLALSAAEPATGETPTRHQGAAERGNRLEPIVLARKPIRGTVAANVVEHGTGALNIDGCRVGTSGATTRSHQAGFQHEGKQGEVHATRGYRSGHDIVPVDAGRWPANVLLDPDTAAELDKQSGVSASTGGAGESSGKLGYHGGGNGNVGNSAGGFGDQGGASRYFPVFKYTPKAPGSERPTADGVSHPTVKPLELMRWLIRLITPPGGTVLDPFAGTGTTAEAAIHEHKRAIVIEREPTYLPLIVARLSKPMQVGFDFDGDLCER